MRPDSRALRLLIAPAVALAVLSGCGGSSGAGDSGSSGSEGSSESADAGDEESQDAEEPAAELTKDDFGQRVLAAFQEAGTVQFALEQGAAGQTTTGTGEADLSGEEIRSRAEIETPQGPVEAIAVDGLFYLKLPQLPGGKYLEVDPDDESGLGALVGQLGGSSDPTAQLEVLDQATAVTAAGEEDVDGVATTKYEVTLPREALVEGLGADPQLAQLLPEEVSYDVWVDADDLVRKLVSVIEVQGQRATTTVTYTGFGEPVDIEAPPADQVTDQVPGASATP